MASLNSSHVRFVASMTARARMGAFLHLPKDFKKGGYHVAWSICVRSWGAWRCSHRGALSKPTPALHPSVVQPGEGWFQNLSCALRWALLCLAGICQTPTKAEVPCPYRSTYNGTKHLRLLLGALQDRPMSPKGPVTRHSPAGPFPRSGSSAVSRGPSKQGAQVLVYNHHQGVVLNCILSGPQTRTSLSWKILAGANWVITGSLNPLHHNKVAIHGETVWLT